MVHTAQAHAFSQPFSYIPLPDLLFVLSVEHHKIITNQNTPTSET